jgi:hypothetical protein
VESAFKLYFFKAYNKSLQVGLDASHFQLFLLNSTIPKGTLEIYISIKFIAQNVENVRHIMILIE